MKKFGEILNMIQVLNFAIDTAHNSNIRQVEAVDGLNNLWEVISKCATKSEYNMTFSELEHIEEKLEETYKKLKPF